MKRQHLVLGAVLVAALGSGAWSLLAPPPATSDPAQVPADDVSVLVSTAPVQQKILPLVMNVFGEVATGTPEALSFAQAGQLVRVAVVAGQQLRRGELIAILSSDPAARSTYAQAVNALTFAQGELRRIQALLALQLATQSQVDGATKQLQDAQAGLAAQVKLGGAHASATLEAPFDCIVTALAAGQGERVQAGATVVQLGRSDRIRVILAIEPSQASLVKPGMPVALMSLQQTPATFTGTIGEVQNLIDPKTQMISAIVALPAARGGQLLSGMRVQGAIELGKRQAWEVPRQAVLTDDKGAYLFQVAYQHARRVDVSKVMETGQMVGVDGKIDGNLPTVVLGNYELRDGMRVREASR